MRAGSFSWRYRTFARAAPIGTEELIDAHSDKSMLRDWQERAGGSRSFRRSVVDTSLPSLTYIGGPTALLQWRGLRMLTDPTFDPAGTVYELPAYTLHKLQGPAIEAGELGGSMSCFSAMSITSTTLIDRDGSCCPALAAC